MNNITFGAVNMGNRKKIFNKQEEKKIEEEEEIKKEVIHQNNSEKNLNNIYDCTICCEEYDSENILFPCKISKNHTICKLCFEDWKNNCCKQYKEVTCPICRNVLPKNGTYTYYYENGVKREEIEYLNDIPHGLVQIWSPNNIIQRKFYTQNYKYHGLYEEYNPLGYLVKRYYYNNGIFNGLFEEYDTMGYLIKRCYYDNNILDGLFEEYYPNEILKVRCNYKQGSICGTYQLFYNSSLLFIECECGPIGGKINGYFHVYDEEGVLIEKYNCKNGRIDIKFDDDLNVSYSKKSGTFDNVDL